MATNIINPRIYTKDSFYYHFVWDWENNEDIDLTQEYEVLVYLREGLNFIKCNLNNLLTVTYNEPISALKIETLCSRESDFLIPDNCSYCKFKIRKKEENPVDWDSEELLMFPDDDYSLMPVPIKCNVVSENNNTRFSFSVSQDLKNYINQTNNYLSKYIITPFKTGSSNPVFPSLNCYLQSSIYSTQFIFDLYYNSDLKLNTEYTAPIFYKRVRGNDHNVIDWDKILPTTDQIVDRFEISLSQGYAGMTHYLPNDNGALVYIEDGAGWKINQQVVEPNSNYKFLGGNLTFDGTEAQTDLIGHFFTAPFEHTYDLERNISITTGLKYAQQIEAFNDLKTIRPISDVSNDEFTYQYNSINEHTPVFIYQKMIDNTYNLTNNSSNLNKGILNTDFENTSKNDLIVTTSPVVDSSNNYTLKTSNITEEEINRYTEEHKDMLNVNKIFNSLEEEFNWSNFEIISEKGQPKLYIKATKNSFSNLYAYKILIQNQMTNRNIVNNEELDFKYLDTIQSWCIYKNNTSYPDGYILSDLVHNELSSKEKYHIIIKRIYNGEEYIIDERDVEYENNTDFFLAPSNNINYNPGEEIDFYFSTERNNSENAAQGYPWLIYNNEDNVGYFCYSNEAQNDLGSASVQLYDKTFSDNKQLIHINYHDKPNFTPKEVIPMLDFKITELIKQQNPYQINVSNIGNQNNVKITSYSNSVTVSSNGDNASFTIKPLIENGYISFAGNSDSVAGSGCIEVLDKETGISLYASNNFSSGEGSYFLKDKKVNNDTTLLFKLPFSNSSVTFTNCTTKTLVQPDNSNALLQKRKFYIDNFSINSIKNTFYKTIVIDDYTSNININDFSYLYISSDDISENQSLFRVFDDTLSSTEDITSYLKSNEPIDITNHSTIKFKGGGSDTTDYHIKCIFISFLDSDNEIDYSQIENGSIISGQVLELHKPITLHIEDFTTNMSSYNSIFYKIEKVNEYNQDVITPIDDDNSITILQKDNNDNMFTKDFYINSHTNQLKIQNTKTKQITFNNAQKDTIVNCILEKEEVED